MWKYQALLLSLTSTMALGAVDLSSFPTKTDPTNVNIPKIPQTTSYDVATECTYYQSNFTYQKDQWPTIWDIATSNGMNTSAEFTQLYNSIDWSKAPNIPVRTLSPQGGLNLAGYDTVNDPACWWSATQCTKPKQEGINADIVNCPEPETWGLVSYLPKYNSSFFRIISPNDGTSRHLMMDPTVHTMPFMTILLRIAKGLPCSTLALMC